MSLVHAFTAIEDRLTELCLKDCWGEDLVGLEAVGIVHREDPEAWKRAEDDLEAGRIDADEYKKQILDVIDRFDRSRYRLRLESHLSGLYPQPGESL